MYTHPHITRAISGEELSTMIANLGNGKIALIDALDVVEHLEDQHLATRIKTFIYDSIDKKLTEKESLGALNHQHLFPLKKFYNIY